MEEFPFVVGPKCNSPIVCLECYKHLKFENKGFENRCLNCKWPLCNKCSKMGAIYHVQNECYIFSKVMVKFFSVYNSTNACPQLDCITPLRVLLAKENNPLRWEKEIAKMEYHDKSRRHLTDIWNADLINIAHYLRGPCKLANRFSEKLIMQVVGILEVNAFEARTPQGYPLRCLYPSTGLLAHGCIPNTARSIYPSEGYKVRLRAMDDLKAGQQLHHSYTFTLNGTAQRQEHLKMGKFFTCECARCKDPTEMATNFSTLKCAKCDNGWILSTNPIDNDAKWKCNACELEISYNEIQNVISVMQTEVAFLQNTSMSSKRLEETERLMQKYHSIIHPLHFIQTALRQDLIEMYGRVEGYEINNLSDVMLKHKENLCYQVLKILDTFEPGLSRSRGKLLYELHIPLILIAKKKYISGVLSSKNFKKELIKATDLLKECIDILKVEDAVSQEGVLGQVAMKALDQITINIHNLNEI